MIKGQRATRPRVAGRDHGPWRSCSCLVWSVPSRSWTKGRFTHRSARSPSSGQQKTLHRNWSEVEHALRRPDKGSAVTSVVCGLGFEQYEDENLPRSGSSVSKSEETPGDLLTWLVGQPRSTPWTSGLVSFHGRHHRLRREGDEGPRNARGVSNLLVTSMSTWALPWRGCHSAEGLHMLWSITSDWFRPPIMAVLKGALNAG